MAVLEGPTVGIESARPPSDRRRAEWLGGAAAALLSFLLAAWVLKLWRADLGVPFRYSADDDTMFYLSAIKGIIDHGWLLTNHALGAPFGQQLYDFPQGADNLNYLILKGLATVWQSPAVINIFFLSTFPLDAVAAFAVMRRLRVALVPAAVCSVLFALLPYHFFRSDSHLMLSAYWSLPLSAYLFIRVVTGEPLPRRSRLVLACIAIASTGLYYAVFGVVLIGCGALIGFAGERRRAGFAVCAAVIAVVALNLAPTFIYQAGHGGNPVVTRSAGAGDDLALSASYLVLPPLNDRIAALRRLTEHYASVTPPHGYCEQCYESIGIVGDVGLFSLGAILLAACLGYARQRPPDRTRVAAALGVAICLVVGVTGGLSSLARVFVSSDIRAWNRMSVLIAFFSLLAVGWLLDRVADRRALSALCAGVLMLGVVDQTSPAFVPPYGRDAQLYRSDAGFVASVQSLLPSGASVFELPYVPFPEGYQPYLSPGQTRPYVSQVGFEYDEARGYIHSSSLRWSYGAIKGRAADWARHLASLPAGWAVAGAAAAGFDGLVLDPRGYPGTWHRLLAQLRRELLVAPVWSPRHDLVFLDLRPLILRMRASDPAAFAALGVAVLHPLRSACAASDPGFAWLPRSFGRTVTAGIAGPPCVRVR